MISKFSHILSLMLASLFFFTGCVPELLPIQKETGFVLTIRCEETLKTKAEMSGVDIFNENLIKSVDFLFYPGANPSMTEDAVYHIRKDMDGIVQREETFNLVIKKNVVDQIFKPENENEATVYVLVNFDESFLREGLSGTSLSALAQRRDSTDFSQSEINYIQPCFRMDGREVISYDENAEPSVYKEIKVTRFAAKLTMAVHVADTVVLKHREKIDSQTHEDITEPDEVWTPVLHTMRVYLVDGVKTMKLSRDGTVLPDPLAGDPVDTENGYPKYFSYRGSERPYVENDNYTPCVDSLIKENAVTHEQTKYYDTYPMYSYPREWTSEQWDYPQVDYTKGLPTEPPYFKLEIDWRRESKNGYSYDLRKYYYKIYLPVSENKISRNRWYSFFLDVGILGSETDEGQVILDPSCYILDWQNKSQIINKSAVISSARYLSVDKEWELHNVTTLRIPFMSSHDVKIVEGSVTATRPYYGEDKSLRYDTFLHAWVKRDSESNTYYLDYKDQGSVGDPLYEPSSWFEEKPNWIDFTHVLDNDYLTSKGFDYSPYTIEFDIVHSDLGRNDPRYEEYIKHIKITQYPGIYIEALLNSDTRVIPAPGNGIGQRAKYPDGTEPWLDKPWGYVYINGRDQPYSGSTDSPDPRKFNEYTRLVRWDKNSKETSKDPIFSLSAANQKEYQWQSVWYTLGSRDMFNIHVTVLPESSSFIIGDPRSDVVDNLDSEKYEGLYNFTNSGTKPMDVILPNRTGFAEAPSLDDEDNTRRKLKWYYPAESSNRTREMIAPIYRIASKFGGTEYGGSAFIGDISKEYAEYRCAAYQEDGFPAGRWRLPTRAEIYFIAQLSAKGAFEALFTVNSSYWSAHGAVRVGNGGVTDVTPDGALLRCVYDSWYWDSYDDRLKEGERNRFVWGDKER